MDDAERIPIIVANWKMYKTLAETEQFIDNAVPLVAQAHARIYIAVPFTAIAAAAEQAADTPFVIGAQNMNDASEGAFTGEVAGKMLVDAGAKFVILGHSERRRIFGEDNAFINRKIKRAFEEGLQPLLCIGETLAEREARETEDVLATQLSECLKGFDTEELASLMIAYEPVWAIGTGRMATPEIAQETHYFCREYLAQQWGPETAGKIPLLYGGSVRPETAPSLVAQADIDGLLVGGASLDAASFASIVNSVSQPIGLDEKN